ncbi:hypothetical protein CY34DRAFT_242126 [Suillus luteus UH-Slu-Lm8-n1]|uniref:Uncharacterized protein n=1 Tax=Suillus luteus UH-Slu-Lm8-n1 TaxID=930992 RepID=A0A0D0AGH6_9AGAM|nr:hypothetical protein CY34DRAFT_242126 [Suillus luteus UH-Slu-Lm8-n1]
MFKTSRCHRWFCVTVRSLRIHILSQGTPPTYKHIRFLKTRSRVCAALDLSDCGSKAIHRLVCSQTSSFLREGHLQRFLCCGRCGERNEVTTTVVP